MTTNPSRKLYYFFHSCHKLWIVSMKFPASIGETSGEVEKRSRAKRDAFPNKQTGICRHVCPEGNLQLYKTIRHHYRKKRQFVVRLK